MKTPKRYPATMSVYATRDELRQDRARWKRKNRIAQLKRTIARQAEEIEHLRTALAIRAASEYNESIPAECKRENILE